MDRLDKPSDPSGPDQWNLPEDFHASDPPVWIVAAADGLIGP